MIFKQWQSQTIRDFCSLWLISAKVKIFRAFAKRAKSTHGKDYSDYQLKTFLIVSTTESCKNISKCYRFPPSCSA